MQKVISICILLFLTGCGTMITQYEMKDGTPMKGPFEGQEIKSKLYSGTVFDVQAQITPPGSGGNIGGLIFLIDLPLSLVADSVIFPYTLYYELAKQEPKNNDGEFN